MNLQRKPWEPGAAVYTIKEDGVQWVPLDDFMAATLEIRRLQAENERLYWNGYFQIPLPRWLAWLDNTERLRARRSA